MTENVHAAQIRALELEVAQLRDGTAARAPIEQAKGALMLRYGIGSDQAFKRLVRWSALHNIKLRTVAATLVQKLTYDHPLDMTASVDPELQASLRDVTHPPVPVTSLRATI